MNTHELKQKQVRLAKLRAEIAEENERLANEQRVLSNKRNEAQALQQAINDFLECQKDPIISEHALLRFFERVKGFDLEQVKAEILTEQVKVLIRQLGSGVYPVNGFKIKVKDGTVVTIV